MAKVRNVFVDLVFPARDRVGTLFLSSIGGRVTRALTQLCDYPVVEGIRDMILSHLDISIEMTRSTVGGIILHNTTTSTPSLIILVY